MGKVEIGKMEKLKRHLDKYLLLYIGLSMIVGLSIGAPFFKQIETMKPFLKSLNLVIIVMMIYPMMVGLNFGELLNIPKMWKQFLFGLIMGLVYAPLFMALLVKLIPMNPYLSFGLILVFSVPCSSMAIAATGLSKGNTELATMLVAIQFILALVVSPVWMSIFGSAYKIPFPVFIIVKTLIIIVAIPMLVGYATKATLKLKGGKAAMSKARSTLPVISFLALFTMIFLIFMEQGHLIVMQWQSVLVTLIPLAIYFTVTILLLTVVDLVFKVKYKDHMAIVFGSIGKNEGTAMAIALAGGIGLAAIPAAIAPLIQVPLLATYLKMHWKIADMFSKRSPHLVNKYELHELELEMEED
ncbi:arsenic resistance protein [Mesoaciditoga lauensis]|uniref:arsenic resistance protein n=1 Tax=Mesoaciditoga lauensis TaxID=1495039 RepID=UPI000689A4A8|nr:bile acid:sodium symporter [Mesoaciditoga lauensis]